MHLTQVLSIGGGHGKSRKSVVARRSLQWERICEMTDAIIAITAAASHAGAILLAIIAASPTSYAASLADQAISVCSAMGSLSAAR